MLFPVDGRGMQNLHFMGLQEQSKLYAVMVFMLKKEKFIHNLQDNSDGAIHLFFIKRYTGYLIVKAVKQLDALGSQLKNMRKGCSEALHAIQKNIMFCNNINNILERQCMNNQPTIEVYKSFLPTGKGLFVA